MHLNRTIWSKASRKRIRELNKFFGQILHPGDEQSLLSRGTAQRSLVNFQPLLVEDSTILTTDTNSAIYQTQLALSDQNEFPSSMNFFCIFAVSVLDAIRLEQRDSDENHSKAEILDGSWLSRASDESLLQKPPYETHTRKSIAILFMLRWVFNENSSCWRRSQRGKSFITSLISCESQRAKLMTSKPHNEKVSQAVNLIHWITTSITANKPHARWLKKRLASAVIGIDSEGKQSECL